MCAAVHDDCNKKKTKSKSMLGNILNRFVSSTSKDMLQTDAVPLDDNNLLNGTEMEISNENVSENLSGLNVPVEHSLSMVQNNMNRSNQSLTVIESQQNLHFSNIHGLQIGNTYHVSGSNSRKSSDNGSYEDVSNNMKKTKSIIELMKCNDLIETKTMLIASRYMGGNWRMVFRDLDITDPEIEQTRQQYDVVGIQEIIYQLLFLWKGTSDDPSIGKLSTVLWKHENIECIKQLKNYFKENKKSKANSITTNSNQTNGELR